jgi:hypothetical protein
MERAMGLFTKDIKPMDDVLLHGLKASIPPRTES